MTSHRLHPRDIGSLALHRGALQLVCLAGLAVLVPMVALRGPAADHASELALLCTGDARGYLVPCGCSTRNQPPGLAKKVAFVQQLRHEAQASLLLDTGNLARDEGTYQTMLGALAAAGYDAVAPGELEAAMGERFLALAEAHEVPVLAAEAAGGEAHGAARRGVMYLDAGVRRVAVTAAGPPEPAREGDPLRHLVTTLRQFRGTADCVVLVSRLGEAIEARIAQIVDGGRPLVDVIVAAGPLGSPSTPPEAPGAIILRMPPDKATVFVVRLRVSDGRPIASAESLPVPDDIEEDPQTVKLVWEHLAARQRSFLREMPGRDESPGPPPRLVLAGKCRECHEPQYEAWARSKHASAVRELEQAGRLLPECLVCHSELYRRTKYFEPEASKAEAVGCAACHGNGIVHASTKSRSYIARTVPEAICRVCHNEEHSSEFAYAEYLARIRH